LNSERRPLNGDWDEGIGKIMLQSFSDGRPSHCSLCDKDITGVGMHILEFHFHLLCANDMAAMMRQVNALNQ